MMLTGLPQLIKNKQKPSPIWLLYMMNSFNNRDFEQFVKQNADEYRMFPSEKVWDNIHHNLHTRNRWYGFGLAFLLLSIGTVTWVMLMTPSDKKQEFANSSIAAVSTKINAIKKDKVEIVIAPAKSKQARISYVASPTNHQKNLFLAEVASLPPKEELENNANQATTISLISPVVAVSVSNDHLHVNRKISSKTSGNIPINNYSNPMAAHTIIKESITIVPPQIQTITEEEIIEPIETFTPASQKDIYPLTIESVVNSYTKIITKKKVSWQVYFLPTVSYRKLSENKSEIINSQAFNVPFNAAIANGINDVVAHKPDVGLELGINGGYPISKNLKITTGLQINVSKYDIKAYPYTTEDARIVLNNQNGSRSLSTIETNYRATESYTKPDWLSNFYISASLPVGVELKIKRINKDSYLGIGGTIQPTYILGERAYVISTDFKNYAILPSLTRNWNVNTSFEIFTGFSSGKINWKIGPQVRYQLLSSFIKKYPVQENLMDFGLKVGLMFNK